MIRRAAELYAAEADADERISEEELLRIAAELGLPSRHVRQALFELPDASADGSLLDRICGPAKVRGVRVVVHDPDYTYRRLDDYLTTREYLHPIRRKTRHAWYAPAEDFVSKFARGLSRPKARFHLARARGVALAVEPLDAVAAHVRLEIDLAGRRRQTVAAGATLGGIVGAAAGAGLAVAAAGAAGDLAGTYGATAAAVLTFGGTLSSAVAAGVAVARARFRKLRALARLEIEGLLDRLERGDPLDPPPAPWRRRLRASVEERLSGRR
ncbi:MAG TPA: hypothetical protein VF212_10575 [Longimicrobiales bacterium]